MKNTISKTMMSILTVLTLCCSPDKNKNTSTLDTEYYTLEYPKNWKVDTKEQDTYVLVAPEKEHGRIMISATSMGKALAEIGKITREMMLSDSAETGARKEKIGNYEFIIDQKMHEGEPTDTLTEAWHSGDDYSIWTLAYEIRADQANQPFVADERKAIRSMLESLKIKPMD